MKSVNMNAEPIIIIEDDADDQEIIKEAFLEMDIQPVVFFSNADAAYAFISNDSVIPKMILSDINLPGMNGLELRDKIHSNDKLRHKCVPYIFMTTGGESRYVWEAYSKNVQGYFIKPDSIRGWKKLLLMTNAYWEESKKPR